MDSQAVEKSYFNDICKSHKNRLYETMNGFTDTNELVHLQINVKNQLFKEIEETQKLEGNFNIDMDALHRNEQT